MGKRLTREEFDALVWSVEKRYARRAGALRARLAWLAALGYAGLLSGLLGALFLVSLFSVAMVYTDGEGRILLGIIGLLILLGSIWGTLRVLLIRMPTPEGHAVSGTEAPALHALLDELQTTIRSARFHHVLVTPQCNAGVIQVPRLGVFGWSRNYLLLGLPLLEQLPPAEFHAVLAHEFAHLSREHGRFSRWIYRLRLSWERIFEQMSQPMAAGSVSFRPLILKFIDWFWPRFNAHAFVLSRLNEYEADAVAARVVGAAHIASSLHRIALHSRYLDEVFWPETWKASTAVPCPPDGVLARLHRALAVGPAPEERLPWVEQALRVPTTNADTHPCLADRLEALHQPPIDAPAAWWNPPNPSAAEALLGGALPAVRNAVEAQWRKEIDRDWRERHARATALNDRLAALTGSSQAPSLDADTLWDRARVTIELHGDEPAGPLLRELLALQPGHAAANFHWGRALLEKNDPAGETHLERAINGQPECTPQACGLLHDYYRRLGRNDRMREVTARLDRHEQQLAASQAERSSVTAADTFIPHGLSEDELTNLREALTSEPALFVAELARKELKHFPEQKLFVLCVRSRRRWFGLPDADAERALASRLSKRVQLPGRVLVFPPRGSFSAIARRLRAVPGARIQPS